MNFLLDILEMLQGAPAGTGMVLALAVAVMMTGMGFADTTGMIGAVDLTAARNAFEGSEAEIDPENIRFMQGRKNKKPIRERVESIKSAFNAGRCVARVVVYKDATTGELFAPNGSHRRQACIELGRRLPVWIVVVENAKERAERESWHANEDNGAARTPADKKFQAKEAYASLKEDLGRPPKPSELAAATHTTDSFARAFLDDLDKKDAKHTGEGEGSGGDGDVAGDNPADSDDEATDTSVPSALEKVLETLKKLKRPDNWKAGARCSSFAKEIMKEIRRLTTNETPAVPVTKEEIKGFMVKHGLNNKQMAKLAEVEPHTVGKWMAGTGAISKSNSRTLRARMQYSEEKIREYLADAAARE